MMLLCLQKKAILTTIGVLEEPLGNARLHGARLVAALLHTNTPSINQELCRLDTLGLLLVSGPAASLHAVRVSRRGWTDRLDTAGDGAQGPAAGPPHLDESLCERRLWCGPRTDPVCRETISWTHSSLTVGCWQGSLRDSGRLMQQADLRGL